MKNKAARQQRRAQVRNQIRSERRKKAGQEHFREPLTGKRARHIAGAEAGVEYDPVIRSIKGQIAGSAKREGEIGGMYDQAAAATGSNIPIAQQGTQTAVNATNDRLAQAAQSDQAMINTITSKDAANAALVGGPIDTAGETQIAAANAARQQQGIALNAPLAAMGASYANELGSRSVATRVRGIEARGEEASRRQKIIQDLQAAKKQRGQAFVKNLSGLREGERQNAIDKLAFGLKRKTAAVSAKQGAARIGVERANAATSRANAATSERNAATSERSAEIAAKNAATSRRSQKATAKHYKESGGKNGLTPSQRHEARHTLNEAKNTARNLYQAAKNKPSSSAEWAAFTVLVGKEVGDQVAAQKAVAALKKRAAGKTGSNANVPWWEK